MTSTASPVRPPKAVAIDAFATESHSDPEEAAAAFAGNLSVTTMSRR